jgi:hypothetical protein
VLCEGFSVNYLVFSAYTVFPFIACSVAGFVGLWIQFQNGQIPVRVTATTIFDIARDFYRTREQNCTESQPRQSINLEDGIHLYRVNSTADSTMNSTPEDIEAKVSVSQPTEENTREVNPTLAPDPSYSTIQVISLLVYVKEKSKGMKL